MCNPHGFRGITEIVPRTRKSKACEDDEATRTPQEDILRKRGCRVATADGVASALAATEQGKFDLIISELGLPDGDDAELMRTLRQKYGMEGIATSGDGTEADIEKSRAAGFHAHLTKPLVISRLEHAILEGR